MERKFQKLEGSFFVDVEMKDLMCGDIIRIMDDGVINLDEWEVASSPYMRDGILTIKVDKYIQEKKNGS